MRGFLSVSLCCLVLGVAVPLQCLASDAEADEAHEPDRGAHIGSQRSWLFFSFVGDGEVGETLGLELESYFPAGKYNVKNISYLEVVDYPRPIPGKPLGNEFPGTTIRAGINDLLSGFWFSPKNAPHRKHHLAWGAATQLPTGTNDGLSSGKYSVGPSFDYEYESGKLFAGIIVIQLWSVAGDSDRKSVSVLMGKPFVVYNFAEKWDLLYMPYGIQVYWTKPTDEAIYFPVGGGVQRHFARGNGKPWNLSVQAFKNVLRPTKGTKYDLRFMMEFVF